MEHVSSVHPTGKFPEKVENLKRWSRFPGWNFRTKCRVPFTFLVVCTSFRSTVGQTATYWGLRPNGTTFYQSEIPLLLPQKSPGFFLNAKRPSSRPRIPRILHFAPACVQTTLNKRSVFIAGGVCPSHFPPTCCIALAQGFSP